MSSSDPNHNVASSDRRSATREQSLGPVRLVVEACSLEGILENKSSNGMFVILDEALNLEVKVGSGRNAKVAQARLTRVAALPGQRSGWGLEIISESSVA